MSTDLRADIVAALHDQTDTMVRVANDSPDILGSPTAHAMIVLVTQTLRQLADRIARAEDTPEG